jgi:hypothetical protein
MDGSRSLWKRQSKMKKINMECINAKQWVNLMVLGRRQEILTHSWLQLIIPKILTQRLLKMINFKIIKLIKQLIVLMLVVLRLLNSGKKEWCALFMKGEHPQECTNQVTNRQYLQRPIILNLTSATMLSPLIFLLRVFQKSCSRIIFQKRSFRIWK